MLYILSDNDSKIKEYLENGGMLFQIQSIDILRDCGTKVIITRGVNISNYYLDKTTFKLYSAYPLKNAGLVTDKLLINYLIDRVTAYIKKIQYIVSVAFIVNGHLNKLFK